MHVICDGRGRVLATRVTPGQASDTRHLLGLLDQVAVHGPAGGRPRKRPASLTADKAYSSKANRAGLRARKVKAVIPERSDQKANRARKGSAGGRPPAFDSAAYKKRNQVERGFNRRKHWRGLATRYDKRIDSYQATLDLAETLDWLRATHDRTP